MERHDIFINYLGECYQAKSPKKRRIRAAGSGKSSKSSVDTAADKGAAVKTNARGSEKGEENSGVGKSFSWKMKRRKEKSQALQDIGSEKAENGNAVYDSKIAVGIKPISVIDAAESSNVKVGKAAQASSKEVPESITSQTNEELDKLLRKGQYERTGRDLKRMFQLLRHLTAFQNLSDFVLMQICGVLHFNEFESNRVVFRQGEEGSSWFVILSGRVQVLIDRAGEINESVPVLELGEGNGFGELALVNDQRRAATILTTTPCKLLRVEKGDYLRILRFVHHSDVREKVLFLKKIPILKAMTDQNLSSIANVMTARTYEPSALLIKQGDRLNEVCFVKKGKCVIEATCEIDGKPRVIKLGELKEGDYFGEEGVLQKIIAEISSPFSIRATDYVQTLALQSHDARAKLSRELVLTTTARIARSQELLKEKWAEWLDRKKWKIYRRRIVTALMKELDIKCLPAEDS
ncbi:hypothetical protein HDU97_003889 [Phlyctochytrium planicorne]|nr:hypothetical protein HDU97_003889 [Phlyctochytrium planicorne]